MLNKKLKQTKGGVFIEYTLVMIMFLLFAVVGVTAFGKTISSELSSENKNSISKTNCKVIGGHWDDETKKCLDKDGNYLEQANPVIDYDNPVKDMYDLTFISSDFNKLSIIYNGNTVLVPANSQKTITLPAETSVSISATPVDDDYIFDSWHFDPVIPSSDDRIGNCSFYVSSNSNIKAIFKEGWMEKEQKEDLHPSEFGLFDASDNLIKSWSDSGIPNNCSGAATKINALPNASEVVKIVFPNTVTSITSSAFKNLTNLKTVILPTGLTSIGDSAFLGTGLVTVSVPDTVTSIQASAFKNCTSLTKVLLPNNVNFKTLSNNVFDGCSSLTSIAIPDSVTALNANSLANTGLKSITYPISATIADSTFANLSSIKTIYLTKGTTGKGVNFSDSNYKYTPWYKSSSVNPTIRLSTGIISLGNNTFRDATYISEIKIPYTVTGIGDKCFYHCTKLSSLEISDNLKTLGVSSFEGCSSLTQIKLPDTLTSVGNTCFKDCNNLTTVSFPISLTISANLFQNDIKIKNVTITKGTGTGVNYNTSTSTYLPWIVAKANNPTVILSDGIKKIGNYFFYNSDLISLTLSNTIEEIGSYAFQNCKKLSFIRLSDNLNKINTYAFDGVNSLNSLIIPDSVTSLEDYSFRNCSGLNDLTMPIHLQPKANTFTNCTNIKTVNLTKGNGSIVNYTSSTYKYTPWYKSLNNKPVILLKDGVNGVGSYTFKDQKFMETMNFPSTVKSIGDYAFENCSSLESAKLSKYATAIGTAAFKNCTKLKSVTLPGVMTGLKNSTLEGCSSLESLTIPSNVTTIGEKALYGCSSLKVLIIPDSTVSVGNNSFANCSSLNDITLPITANYSNSAFSGTQNIESVTLTSGTSSSIAKDYSSSSIYQYTPWYQSRGKIKTVTLADGITKIGNSMFYGCTSLESVSFSNSINSLGTSAFQNCTSLQEAKLPNGIIEIPSSAFYGCTSLKTLIIPESIKTVKSSAFQNCTNLMNLTIPFSTLVENNGFAGCSNISMLTLTKGDYGSSCTTSRGNMPWYISRGKVQTIIMKSGITSIPNACFRELTTLYSITLPNTLTTLGNEVFYGDTNLHELIIPNTVSSIGTNLCYNCKGLNNITLSNSLTSIPNSAFQNCTNIEDINIPTGITSIGTSAFYGCTSLEEVDIPKTVTSVGNNSFQGCSNIIKIKLPLNMTYGKDAFKNVTIAKDVTLIHGNGTYPNFTTTTRQYTPWWQSRAVLTNLILSDGITSIPNYAFSNLTSTNFTNITIPDSVTSVGTYAFDGDSNLNTVTISKNSVSIGNNAFNACNNISTISMPISATIGNNSTFTTTKVTHLNLTCGSTNTNGVNYTSSTYAYTPWYKSRAVLTYINLDNDITRIGNYTFANLNLTEFTFPNKLSTIGQNSFMNITGLAILNFPNTLTAIEDNAFAQNSGLRKIEIPIDTTISQTAFTASNGVRSVSLTAGLTGIGKDYTSSTSLYLPWNISTSTLTSVTLATNINTVGSYTFNNPFNVSSINVAAIPNLHSNAFYNVQQIYYSGSSTGSPWGAKKVN